MSQAPFALCRIQFSRTWPAVLVSRPFLAALRIILVCILACIQPRKLFSSYFREFVGLRISPC